MGKTFIVWNAARNEAVVFTDRADANSAASGKPRRRRGYRSISCLAETFFESYGDEGLKVEVLVVEPPKGK